MISELIGARIRNSTLRLGEALARWGLTPNLLTAVGLLLNLLVAAVIASGNLRLGGVLLLIASGFDMLDGAVARATGTVTKFGGFLDSTIDRYSESIVYGGVLLFLLGTQDFKVGSLLVFVATAGSLLIS
ncbi:MAG TPA: CDP-alcohol phosphatidyltransferase family protein, partial [Gemmatimonadales bacterium]|nr:CDP-alcohol phosphatidyltransferase family protein [Gemmatimonadales bacterium]